MPLFYFKRFEFHPSNRPANDWRWLISSMVIRFVVLLLLVICVIIPLIMALGEATP